MGRNASDHNDGASATARAHNLMQLSHGSEDQRLALILVCLLRPSRSRQRVELDSDLDSDLELLLDQLLPPIFVIIIVIVYIQTPLARLLSLEPNRSISQQATDPPINKKPFRQKH